MDSSNSYESAAPAFTISVFNVNAYIDKQCSSHHCDCASKSSDGTECVICIICTYIPGQQRDLISMIQHREATFPSPTSAIEYYLLHDAVNYSQDSYHDFSVSLIIPRDLTIGVHDEILFMGSKFGMSLSEILEKHL